MGLTGHGPFPPAVVALQTQFNALRSAGRHASYDAPAHAARRTRPDHRFRLAHGRESYGNVARSSVREFLTVGTTRPGSQKSSCHIEQPNAQAG
jgi:hypothetical protein